MLGIKKIINSVSTKIIIIMILLVFPLNLIAIIYTNQAVRSILDQAEYYSQNVADYQMRSLGRQMEMSQSFLAYFNMEDVDCARLMLGLDNGYDYESAKMKVYSRIKNMASVSNGADGYFFYYPDKSDGIIYGVSNGERGFTSRIKDFLKEYTDENNTRGWHIYNWDNELYLVLVIQNKNMLYGSVIRLKPYFEAVEKDVKYPVSKIYFTEKNIQTKSKNIILVHSSIGSIFLNIEVKQSEIIKNMLYSHQIFWNLVAFIYLILIPLLYLIFRRLLICPLNELNKAHRQVEFANSNYRIHAIPKSIEFKELFDSFNKMAENLNNLKIESYEKELSRQKMELKNLQLQIRPHFLLNTLNIIFSLSQKRENEMVQKTIIYLSEYFRYIFRNDKDLELFPKELNLIQGYIQIAGIRYSGRVEIEFDIDPELDLLRVPPLLVHNFIENAVKYGIRQNEVLHIWVEGHYNNGIVSIWIEDDGNGMTKEVMDRLCMIFNGELQLDDEYQHIGLYNSLKRIKYFYGDDAYIQVKSQLEIGSCFTICFPYNLEVEDESADCK